MRQRWYDFDPVISLAVNLIEESDERTRKHCLDYIIERATDCGMKLDNKMEDSFDMFWKRETDSESHFFEAMEYFKKGDTGFQKDIAMGIVNYVEKLNEELEKD